MNPSPPPVTEEDDFISLAPLWGLIRRYHRWLELGFFGLIFLGAGGLAVAWLWLPHSATASIGLKLRFPGAAQGQYPNKTPFFPADLVGTEVLRRVYVANHLEPYVTFDAFKTSLSVEPAGLDLLLLEREYGVKLEDRKLTPAERRQIGEEYQKRRAELSILEYRLSWRQVGRAARLVPASLQAKVLEDIPRQWAEEAVRNRKVLEAAGNLPSRIQSENSEIKIVSNAIDLGERIRALARSLAQLRALPGAAHVLLGDGTSLVDLGIRLQVLRENGLNNIREALRVFAGTPEGKTYLEQVLQARLRARQKILLLEKGRLQPQEEAYRDYLASRPGAEGSRPSPDRSLAAAGPTLQISDAFLGKWMEMTKSVADETYRQDLVNRMVAGREEVLDAEANVQEIQSYLRDFEEQPGPGRAGAGKPGPAPGPPSAGEAKPSRIKALQAMQEAATELNALIVAADKLKSLQAQNYQLPQSSMYLTSAPFRLESSSPVNLRNAGVFLAAFVFLGLGLMLVACWAHDQSTKPQV